jgi:hypothetical protein
MGLPDWEGFGANFNNDRSRRYRLWRAWGGGSRVCFVMLNPSIADETILDPTIRRCIGFARAWSMSGLYVVNLFSIVSSCPKVLAANPESIDLENDLHIIRTARSSSLVVCAWGAFPAAQDRGQRVTTLLHDEGVATHCLGKTKGGYPRHPLYLRANTKLEEW